MIMTLLKECYLYLGFLALQWYNSYLESPEKHFSELTSWNSFAAAMKSPFGELNKELVASSNIRKLCQQSTSTSQYAETFKQLASDLQWNDSAPMSQFRDGLRDEVKDMLLHHDPSPSLTSLIALSIRCDNRWRERQLQKTQNPTPAFTGFTPQSKSV